MFSFLVSRLFFNTSLYGGLGMTLRLRGLGSRLLLLNSNVMNMEIISSEKCLPSSRLHVKPFNT